MESECSSVSSLFSTQYEKDQIRKETVTEFGNLIRIEMNNWIKRVSHKADTCDGCEDVVLVRDLRNFINN